MRKEANIGSKLFNFRNHLEVYQCIDGLFKISDVNAYDESENCMNEYLLYQLILLHTNDTIYKKYRHSLNVCM